MNPISVESLVLGDYFRDNNQMRTANLNGRDDVEIRRKTGSRGTECRAELRWAARPVGQASGKGKENEDGQGRR